MNLLFKFFLTLNTTSWMLVIYWIKEGVILGQTSKGVSAFILLLIPILLSSFSILISRFLNNETLTGCKEFCLADNEFLPIYLGYFFVSLSVPDDITMIYLYFIIFVFTWLSQTQYFNPIFLLFGYHYYHVQTINGTKIFIIKKGKVIRNKDNMSFNNLKRINDSTYIQRKED
mgnify:CR=1 FL=1